MAGTDITSLLEAIQKKIDAVDSSASSGDLLRLLSSVRQAGTGSLLSYDNESQIPNLLDGTPDPGMITYTLDSDKLYFQKGSWVGKAPAFPPFQGSTSGYTSGGQGSNVIDKYDYASDGDATDVGDLTTSRHSVGQSSANHGYSTGYASGGVTNTAVDKFPFASDFTGNATDVGDLAVWVAIGAGQSSIENGFGYHTGGNLQAPPPGASNNIQKFSFATDGDGTDVGDLSLSRYTMTGQSSSENGYTSGGIGAAGPSAREDVIDKFPFASDGDATDVGNLTIGRYGLSGQSSSTHGYSSGGFITTNRIDKFSFATDGNATDVGDLTAGRYTYTAGTSSTASGYATGPSLLVDKFPFSSDANATDVLNLTVTRQYAAGQQI
jgi:hypothetical protein